MTQDEIFKMARESDLGFLLGDSWLMHHEIEYFAKLVANHEREACAYRAGIALLGADRNLANRVDQAIKAKDAT